VAAAVLFLLPASASAQRVTVTSVADAEVGECTPEPGGCTLREAMMATPENTIVDLPAGTYDLTEGPLPAGNGRFLVGAGARTTTITAGDSSRVMTVGSSVNVSGVTISDGSVGGGQGGGIHVGPGAELNLIESAVLSSSAERGGGIYSEGTLRIERSTIAFNDAEGENPLGGGLAIADGDAKLFDTTISTNFSQETGAGLYTSANVELHNVTIAHNEARAPEGTEPSTGGGIQQAFDEANDRTVAFNTLVVENFGGNCLGTTGAAGMIDARFSMGDDMLCNVPTEPSFGNTPITSSADITDLRHNGGETDTHELLEGSPAIGRAEPGTCEGTFDQRGLARPSGADGCDVGAYERAGELTVSTTTDQAGLCTDTDCSLREAIDLVADEGEVEVPSGNYGLSRGMLTIDREVVVRGAGAPHTTFTAGLGSRVLHVFEGGFVTLVGVRITGGNVMQEQDPLGPVGGGVAVTDAAVQLIDSAVDNNIARRGGGIYSDDGGVLLTDTTVASNEAPDQEVGWGGGLYLVESTALLENSTISGNMAGVTGGGIATIGSMLHLSSVTLADNSTLFSQQLGSAIFRQILDEDGQDRGETVARNTLMAENPGIDCAGVGPFEVTNAISDDASCPGQLVADAVIGDLAANDGETDTHALLAGSPAIDAGAGCPLGDQRGVSRPQGVGCDVGAYELIVSSPPSSSGGGGGGGNTIQPPPEDGEELPPPDAGKEVNALPKSGTVRVKVAGTNRFVELEEGQQIPVGSVIDTTKGRVTIVAAGGQAADFYDGIFRITQGKGARPLTTLTLVEALSCPKAGKAVAAAKKKKRRLWGDGNGKFRTKGKHSAATVVGTKWLVEDRCSSTLTRVVRGRVSVRDFVKKKTVIVRAGKKYVARAKKQ
jgi:CSLREA domain-containing protein